MCNLRHSVEWSAAFGASFQEVFHDVEHDTPARYAVLFAYEYHVISVEHREIEAYEEFRSIVYGVPSGSRSHPLHVFVFHFDVIIKCYPYLLGCKVGANACNENLFSDCRVQPGFCKDSASERNENLFSNCRVQPDFCKYTKSCTPFASFSGKKWNNLAGWLFILLFNLLVSVIFFLYPCFVFVFYLFLNAKQHASAFFIRRKDGKVYFIDDVYSLHGVCCIYA